MKKLLVILLFLPSCIAVRENLLKPIPRLPSESLDVSINIKATKTMGINGIDYNFESLHKRLEEETINRFINSKLFHNVGNDLSNYDYELVLNITTKSFDMTSMFCFFSLGIIPSYQPTEVIVQAELTNSKNQKTTKIIFKENYTTWTQILLIFAMPNHYPNDVIENLDNDVFNNLIQKTYQQIKLQSK